MQIPNLQVYFNSGESDAQMQWIQIHQFVTECTNFPSSSSSLVMLPQFSCVLFFFNFLFSFTWVFWSLWDFYAHGQRRSLRPTDQFPGENGIRRQGRNTIQVVTTSKVFLPQNCIVYRKKVLLVKSNNKTSYYNIYHFRQFNKLTNLPKAALADKDAIMNLNIWEWGFQSFFRRKRARCSDCFLEFQLNIGGKGLQIVFSFFKLELLERGLYGVPGGRTQNVDFSRHSRILLESVWKLKPASVLNEASCYIPTAICFFSAYFFNLFEAPFHQFRLTETLMNGWSTIVESM